MTKAERQARRISVLSKALRFYAERTNYRGRGVQMDPIPSVVDEDKGERARKALADDPYRDAP